MSSSNNNLVGKLPILDGKNYDRWKTQMRVIFGFQGVMGVVTTGVQDLSENPSDAQIATHEEVKKLDHKALFLIHQCAGHVNFDKIASGDSAKVAWVILEKCNARDDRFNKVRLQTLKKQFELLQMESQEKIADYFGRVRNITNLMKGCCKPISNLTIVEKVLTTLTQKFDYIVCEIEESKPLDTIKVEVLQGSLEAHEQRINETKLNEIW